MPSSDDLKNPGTLLRPALPTTKHARTFFDLVVDRLGDRAYVLTAGGGRGRQVHVRDDGGIVPWPLASVSVTDPELLDAQEAEADAERSEPWKDPAAPDASGRFELKFHAVAASVNVWDGATYVNVNYGRDGKATDAAGPLDPVMFASLASALAAGTESRLELLAGWLVGLAVGRHGPARVLVPRPMAGGPQGVWGVARAAVRRAIAEGLAPAAASWAVADGVVGTAVVFGPTRDAALASWREAVVRARPTPPKRPPPFEPGTTFEPTSWQPGGPGFQASFFVQSAGWDAPPFDGSPEAIPAAVVPLEAARTDASARGERLRFLGEHGTTEYALRIARQGGFLLVGDALDGRVDLDSLESARRKARRNAPGPEMREMFAARSGVELKTSVFWFRCVDERSGAPCAPIVQNSAQTPEFDAAGFDGASLRHSIVEVSPLT